MGQITAKSLRKEIGYQITTESGMSSYESHDATEVEIN